MSSSPTQVNSENQESNIDQLLQTGFETIVQAFELKNTTYQATIKEQTSTITDLKTKIKLLKEEIEILKQENSFYKKENEQLRITNMKLNSSLRTSQNRLKTIRNSINEEKDYVNYYNTNANESSSNINEGESGYNQENQTPLTDRRDHQYQKKVKSEKNKNNGFRKNPFGHLTSNNSSSNLYNNNNDSNTNSKINKYGHIETRINTLKKNLSSRNEVTLNPHRSINEKIPYQLKSNTRINNDLPPSNGPRFNQLDFTTINQNNNPRSLSVSRPEYNRVKDYEYDENKYQRNQKSNNNVSLESNISNNSSKQYELTNQFLNQCKLYLSSGNFERIVNTFQDYKDGLISDDEIVSRTRMILQGNNNLLNLFESLFFID